MRAHLRTPHAARRSAPQPPPCAVPSGDRPLAACRRHSASVPHPRTPPFPTVHNPVPPSVKYTLRRLQELLQPITDCKSFCNALHQCTAWLPDIFLYVADKRCASRCEHISWSFAGPALWPVSDRGRPPHRIATHAHDTISTLTAHARPTLLCSAPPQPPLERPQWHFTPRHTHTRQRSPCCSLPR